MKTTYFIFKTIGDKEYKMVTRKSEKAVDAYANREYHKLIGTGREHDLTITVYNNKNNKKTEYGE